MALLKGQTIILFERHQTGVDGFNAPIFEETAVVVDNILICPASAEDVTDNLQLHGRHAIYELLIPKEDTNQWENREVSFLGKRWKTFGPLLEWPAGLTPGPWNRKIKVEWYG